MRRDLSRALFASIALLAGSVAAVEARAQAVRGTCVSCGMDPNCGACIVNGASCFNTLPAAERRPTIFTTSDGRDARMLTFGRLVRGASTSASDLNRAVGNQYNGGMIYLYYGSAALNAMGWCAPPGRPPAAFADASRYVFGWNHAYEDTLNGLDCFNGEVDRYYLRAPGHADGDRVCDGEQAMFDPAAGAIFDLGGDGNRVAVFPYTDHGPLPCESFEYSVWLSNNPMATEVADAAHPDPTKWNPAVLTRAFLQGWIPDMAIDGQAVSTDLLNPNLNNPSQRDGIVQVFALPCGITFRYASIVAGNNGNPSSACNFYSFDAELDAVAGLNEDDTAVCPDRDMDGFRDATCGGNDCDDTDPAVHPGAVEDCRSTRDLNCDGHVTACPTGLACVNGLCVSGCLEGACADGFACTHVAMPSGSYCVPSACASMSCPDGQVCGPRGCQAPCTGAVCPVGQSCFGGACVDSCVGVRCTTNQHCEMGRCVPNCSCAGCPAGQSCSMSSGRCESAACGLLPCPPEQRNCSANPPRCASAFCDGVLCPVGQRCDATRRACVPDRCFGVSCPSGTECREGLCVAQSADAGRPDGAAADAGSADSSSFDASSADAGSADGSGASGDGAAGDGGRTPAQSGCGCRTAGQGSGSRGALALGALAVGAALASRRRAKRA